MKKSWKMIGTSALGNALEFYDFVICGVFIAKISEVFFPSTSPTIALFASIFAFSAAFFTRPLGAYAFGLIGKNYKDYRNFLFLYIKKLVLYNTYIPKLDSSHTCSYNET